jgi:hypothetical protein
MLLAGLLAAVAVAGVSVAQAPQRPPERDGAMGMRPMRHGPRGRGRDGVTMLLDHQLALQLTPAQVTQLITIHQQEVAQERPLFARMTALIPRDRNAWRSITPAQRDSLGAIRESMREIQWRQVSAAAAVLTDEQKRVAARLGERHRGRGGPDGRMGRRPMGPPRMRADSAGAGAH